MFTPQNMFDKKGKKNMYNIIQNFQLKSEDAKMLHRLFLFFSFFSIFFSFFF